MEKANWKDKQCKVIVPVDLFGIYEADISEDEWKFTITDPQSVRNLMIL